MNVTILKHVSSYKNEDPVFVRMMLRSLYVTDLSLSLKDVEKAYELYCKSRERMSEGAFNLRKWLSNSRPLMEKFAAMELQGESGSAVEENNPVQEDETFNRTRERYQHKTKGTWHKLELCG